MISDTIFKSSELRLPTEPAGIVPEGPFWSECIVNRAGIILALFLLVLNLKNFLHLWPYITDCLRRTRGSLSLEHSISVARSRDLTALSCIIPFCLVVDRFGLYPAAFLTALPQGWRVPATVGVLLAFLCLRLLMQAVFGGRMGRGDFRSAVQCTLLNYFLALVIVMLVSVGVILVAGVPDGAARTILLVETGFFYLCSTVRTLQILATRYSVFPTFLYLCALEFLPAGALVAAALVI